MGRFFPNVPTILMQLWTYMVTGSLTVAIITPIETVKVGWELPWDFSNLPCNYNQMSPQLLVPLGCIQFGALPLGYVEYGEGMCLIGFDR